jgi:hypothetical protein
MHVIMLTGALNIYCLVTTQSVVQNTVCNCIAMLAVDCTKVMVTVVGLLPSHAANEYSEQNTFQLYIHIDGQP